MAVIAKKEADIGLSRRNGDVTRLFLVFIAWKTLLILLATCSPGPGYDTSGLIALTEEDHARSSIQPSSLIDRLALSHLRWDALYFVKAAQRGYLYEQEWAFSRVYSFILQTVKNWLWGNEDTALKDYVSAGVLLSNVFHLCSVFALYHFARTALSPKQNPNVPFIAALLHVLSPAGLFLSAPYSESLFSAINFTGMTYYVLAKRAGAAAGTWSGAQDVYMLTSGLVFAGATFVRSNGLLNGLIFLYDVACVVRRVLAFQFKMHDARRLLVACVAGAILSTGYIVPQLEAYRQYCMSGSGSPRSWCLDLVPSIYSWVQKHYWDVGFLRYWNLPNLPLFLMAAPMIWLLSSTSIAVLRGPATSSTPGRPGNSPSRANTASAELGLLDLPQIALPQLALTAAALTSFHVQIINRLSSGYPIWYLVVATWITAQGPASAGGKEDSLPQWIVRGIIMYAVVQGLLFAAFLPPA